MFFSIKTNYQVTRVLGGNEDAKSVSKKEVLALFAGKKISRDDTLKELGDANGATLYLIHIKGDKNIVYFDNGPSNAIVSYQGKYYQIENPKYPIDFWFAK